MSLERTAIVNSTTYKKDPPTLNPSTTFIHVSGHLFIWLLKDLIARYPELDKVQVKKCDHMMLRGHFKIASNAGVQIVVGKAKEGFGHGRRKIYPGYKKNRNFFMSMSDEVKKHWDELLLFEIREALLAKRYYCLNGEEPISLWQLAVEFNLSALPSMMSFFIHAVRRYLDSQYETSTHGIQQAGRIKTRVNTFRRRAANRQEYLKRLNLLGLKEDELPKGISPGYHRRYSKALHAYKEGVFDYIAPKWARCVIVRFGLEDGKFKTLEETGEIIGITRERVRQLEYLALLHVDRVKLNPGIVLPMEEKGEGAVSTEVLNEGLAWL